MPNNYRLNLSNEEAQAPAHPKHFKKHKEKTKHHHDHSHGHSHGHSHDHSHSHDNHWLKSAVGLIWGIGLLIISIAGFNIPLAAYYAITSLSTLMTLYLGQTVYKMAWHALLEKKWDTSTLYTISTLTIVVVSIVSMFVPGLPMMLEAAPLVLGFWHLGEAIEHTLIGEINNKLDVRDCVPPRVLLKGNPTKEISVKKLKPQDIIIVKQGCVIPVDGILTQSALLYTTRIDGSPKLKLFRAGDAVKSGMRLADHLPSVEMCVTKTYQDSYLSQIAKNIKKANDEKAPIELLANKILQYFIPGLLGISLVSGIVIGTLFGPGLAIQCLVSVLVSACPCALSLITPMAVKIGMKKASEQGIHFKNGKTLQAASDIDDIVFDLNGTLTKGSLEVHSLHIDDEKFLSHFAALEGLSEHPAAKIIKSYIKGKGVVSKELLELSSIDKSNHSGIKASINGETFMIGNKNMLLENGITHIDKPYDNPEKGSVYMVHGTKVIGQIDLFDPLRDDAVATVKHLQRLGKTVHICTGADTATAKKYAKLLGISEKNICANTVGAASRLDEVSKTSYIQQLKRQGRKVAMVGDAANDVTAIADAHLGIAVKSSIGDGITEQYAGVVVQQGLLFPIAIAFDIAEKTKHNIHQNLFLSLTYNTAITLVAAGSLVAVGVTLSPGFGVAFVVIESTLVLGNLLRFKYQEILSSASNEAFEAEENILGNTTANVLRALGHRAQPEKDLDTGTVSDRLNNSTNLFTPAPSSQPSEEIQEENGLSMA